MSYGFYSGFFIFILPLVISGCSPLAALNKVISDEDYWVSGDFAYGESPRQKLDVYLPNHFTPPTKVVVFFYGGRWQSGSKEEYRFIGEALTAHGIITVIPDYRLYPEVRFPEFIEDGAKAVRWVQTYISRFRGDPKQIYLVGHSAGAYIAAMLALNESYLGKEAVRGMVGLAGPYDFMPVQDKDLQDIFGGSGERNTLLHTQPIYFANSDRPPLLLLSGERDTIVDAGNTLRLAARIRAQGGRVQMILYPNVNHTEILVAFAAPFQKWAPTLRDVVEFIWAG